MDCLQIYPHIEVVKRSISYSLINGISVYLSTKFLYVLFSLFSSGVPVNCQIDTIFKNALHSFVKLSPLSSMGTHQANKNPIIISTLSFANPQTYEPEL